MVDQNGNYFSDDGQEEACYHAPVHQVGSTRSRSMSIVSDVEMAQDEVYAGPVSESIPSSIASFAPRRSRRDSTVSFAYFEESTENPVWIDEEAIVDESEPEHYFEEGQDIDIDVSRSPVSFLDRSRSRSSAEHPLLRRETSDRGGYEGPPSGGNVSQKVYIVTEDLTAVIAGFSTSIAGFTIYVIICILTCGLGYLVFRWLPRWRIKLVGFPEPLYRCQWVAIENQWGQFTVEYVTNAKYGRQLSTVFGSSYKDFEAPNFDEDNDPILPYLRFVDYRYVRFCYQPLEDKFMHTGDWKDPNWISVKTLREGLDAEERDRREQVFGQNIIDIQQKSVPQIMIDEAFHPFYVFQVASLILWSLDEYYYYAACIFFISLSSIAATTLETKSTMERLRQISHFECDVRVLRSGFWRPIASRELTPGDVYEISDPSLTQVPCDSLLLSGDCIVNESMLTGESVPVSKLPATNDALASLNLNAPSIQPTVARHFLFCGTRIIRARRPQDPETDEAAALAMVVRTGFNTTKGALVRSMLFPKPSGFKFYRDSFRYISVMSFVAALGFIASFINFIRLGIAWHTIIVRALDLITIVVPPALPATLTIGTNFALSRLKKQKIFCISPQRVNVAGKLDVVCFDKTGTLTEDGLDVLGVRLVNQDFRFSELLVDASSILPYPLYERDPTIDYNFNAAILYTMATCHSLKLVDGELIGDPLDVKMFEFTGWSYEEGNHNTSDADEESESFIPSVAWAPPTLTPGDPEQGTRLSTELAVMRTFEFVSQLRRSSVLVREPGDQDVTVFVKGAPESLKDICVPKTLPPDFNELLNFYTHRGYRVIACAMKHIDNLNQNGVLKISRSQAESDLTFVGFIVFENKLKPSTTGVINELHNAGVRNIMCTGDNILTAISVARESGFIGDTAQCFVPYFVEGNPYNPRSRLRWESTDNPDYLLDEHTLAPLPISTVPDTSIPYHNYNKFKYSIAVTGDVFRWVVDYGSEEVLQKMLVHGQVFARMSPDEKHELVEKLQSLDYVCGFCGDGANDCGALKAADVGISLSEAEASVAAPFTSRIFDISCVPKLIREGRAALVTSFSCFKYMSLYSAIQFTSVSFLYASASNLGDFQFLYIDLALILPIAIFMGWIGPYSKLCRKRPTANLVSRKVLTPLLGQIVICIFIQLAAFETVQEQEWYKPPKLNPNDTSIENSQNTALFLVSCYQYILSGLVLSVGPPFRQPMTSNVPFVVTIIVALLVSSYMLFQPADWLFRLMQLTYLSTPFKGWLVALAVGGFAVAYVSERHLFPELSRLLGHVYRVCRPGKRKQRRRYKVLLERE
ncbi:P-type ATPase [Coccidioides immitis RS]|uniref:Cation-transporting ATPase n=1 Tax=Coccidioides immitis (strain RS) TaxID=246410 RepID=A0A0E1RVY0_COCIM|nr:P-type ATPase [Coccidioides immitis RS]EAS30876.2 P-type ATPase [Coccidioides immitis RS]